MTRLEDWRMCPVLDILRPQNNKGLMTSLNCHNNVRNYVVNFFQLNWYSGNNFLWQQTLLNDCTTTRVFLFKIYIKVSLHCFLTFRNKNIKDISMPSFFCLFPFFFCRIFCSSTYVGNPIEVLSCKILFFLNLNFYARWRRIAFQWYIQFLLSWIIFLNVHLFFCHPWPLV